MFKAWVYDSIHIKLEMQLPRPDFNGDLVKAQLNLGYEWVIMSHKNNGCNWLCML